MNGRNRTAKEEPAAQGPAAEGAAVGGLNSVLAALKSRPRRCRGLMIGEGRRFNPALEEIAALARANGLAIKRVPRQALDRLYGGEGHQGVVALFDEADYTAWDDFILSLAGRSPALVLALDQVEDPGNLGALMRSACAFGAAGVVVPRERTAPLTQAAVKASAGATENLPLVRVVNLRRALETLKDYGFWLVGAEEGEDGSLFDFDFPQKTALLLGSEGRGLSRTSRELCDFLISIPQNTGQVNSLNVSVAGGIMMAQYYRQFLTKKP